MAKAPSDGHYTMPDTKVRFRARKGDVLPPDATFVGGEAPADEPAAVEEPAKPKRGKKAAAGPTETTAAEGPTDELTAAGTSWGTGFQPPRS